MSVVPSCTNSVCISGESGRGGNCALQVAICNSVRVTGGKKHQSISKHYVLPASIVLHYLAQYLVQQLWDALL